MASSPTKLPNPILMAASRRAPDLVLAILAHRLAPRVDLNERDSEGVTALGRLVFGQGGYSTEVDALMALIDAGADPTVEVTDLDSSGHFESRPQIPIALAAARRGHSVCRALFDALGPAKLKKICDAHPMLHACVELGHEDLVLTLARAGADVNQTFPRAGFAVSRARAPAMFSLLVSNGAKLNLPDTEGKSALQALSRTAPADISAMAAKAAQAEAQGKTAVFSEGERVEKTKAGDEIAEGLTLALFEAVDARDAERARMLWERLGLGRDKRRLFAARDATGRTLLHAAIEARSFSLAKRLLDRGMDVNAFDHLDRTPASVLLDLSTNYAHERDRSGKRREAFAAKVFERVDWSVKTKQGRCLLETMLTLNFESANNLSRSSLCTKALAGANDWLTLEADGSCMLSRAFAKALPHRYLLSTGNFLSELHRRMGLGKLLLDQVQRPEFAPAALGVLNACCSAEQVERWGPVRSSCAQETMGALLEALPVFRAAVDPESVAWSPDLAERAPALHSAVETWRLEALGLASGGARAKARSL
jgi:ankyrin repeat protein